MRRLPRLVLPMVLLLPACPAPPPAPDAGSRQGEAALRRELETHYAAWRASLEAKALVSDTGVLVDDPAYEAIVAMGPKALPFVMEKIAAGEFLMNDAAARITGVNPWAEGEPADPRWGRTGRVYGAQDTSRRWLEWWEAHKGDPAWAP